jgi:hypothetical protein
VSFREPGRARESRWNIASGPGIIKTRTTLGNVPGTSP